MLVQGDLKSLINGTQMKLDSPLQQVKIKNLLHTSFLWRWKIAGPHTPEMVSLSRKEQKKSAAENH